MFFACATAPVFRDAVLEYPHPANEVCSIEPGAPSARYVVTVALQGFMPETRALELKPGCSGNLVLVLSVASTDLLKTLGGTR